MILSRCFELWYYVKDPMLGDKMDQYVAICRYVFFAVMRFLVLSIDCYFAYISKR